MCPIRQPRKQYVREIQFKKNKIALLYNHAVLCWLYSLTNMPPRSNISKIWTHFSNLLYFKSGKLCNKSLQWCPCRKNQTLFQQPLKYSIGCNKVKKKSCWQKNTKEKINNYVDPEKDWHGSENDIWPLCLNEYNRSNWPNCWQLNTFSRSEIISYKKKTKSQNLCAKSHINFISAIWPYIVNILNIMCL